MEERGVRRTQDAHPHIGDDAFFTECYLEHHRRIQSFLRRRVATSVVDDLVAETFLVAWRRISEIPRTPNGQIGWLLRTAHYVALNHLRRDRRQRALTDRMATELPCAIPQEHPFTAVESLPMSDLQDLSPADRLVLELATRIGPSSNELARRLGCKPDAARARLSRARRRARALLA